MSTPRFPDRPLVLHAARPREYDAGHRFCLCITASVAMAKITGITGSIWSTKPAFWQSRSSSPRRRSPNIFGTISAICTPKTARRTRAKHGPSASTQRLFEQLRAQGVTTRQRYGLFGHSAGGQFVHRMFSFGFRDRVAVAVSANAGTYAMPDLATPWPFGLGETDVDTDALRALLAFPITVMAGTEDVSDHGALLPKGPAFYAPGCDPL